MECRFCFEDGQLISPCKCSGSQKWIHEVCLKKWYEMKSENRVCSVCKYRFKVQQLGYIEFVPPRLEIYTHNMINQTFLELLVNLGFYAQVLILVPDVWSNGTWVLSTWVLSTGPPGTGPPGTYYDHAAFQILYLLMYYTFAYLRYYRLIQNKRLYLSLLKNDVKKLLVIQLVAVIGLAFIHNVVYHYSAIFLATYVRQPVLYFHYKTLKTVNDRLEYRFVSAEPTSSS
jgi:hypothetical protein